MEKIIQSLDRADAHPYGLRPFKRDNYINKFRVLTKSILQDKEINRFLNVVKNLKKLKKGDLYKLNLEIKRNKIKRNKRKGIF